MALVALAGNPLPQKLRVGLFADSALQPRWVVEAFAKVAASDFAEIVIVAGGGAPPRPVPWIFRTGDRDALLDLARYVPHRRAGKQDLDVAFALGEFDDTVLDGIARLGVWRFDADGVREVVEGAPLTGSGLKVRLAPGAEPRLACQSWSRTERLSIARNRDRLLAKTAEFACRALRDAQRFGRGWLEQCKPVPQKQGETTISATSALAAVLRNRGLALVSSLLHVEETCVAFRRGNGGIAAGRWWLFAAGAFDEELHLYHAPRLAGPWQPHPRNPVRSDARCARPAGRLSWRNGALYRPARIGVPHEGAGVSLNRVLRLTPHDYAERQVERILGIRGVSQAGGLTVVDAFARRRRFA